MSDQRHHVCSLLSWSPQAFRTEEHHAAIAISKSRSTGSTTCKQSPRPIKSHSTTFEHDAAPWRDPVNFEVLLHPMGTASCPFSVFQVPYEGQETRPLRPIISDKHTELSLELHNSMHDTNGPGIAHGAQPS